MPPATRFAALLPAILSALFLAACSREVDANTDEARRFLYDLEGRWTGTAERTPRGPMSYNIVYERKSQSLVGIARPGDGRTRHVWKFSPNGNTLALDFLSTFGGNQEDMRLAGEPLGPGEYVFTHQRPNFLEVQVRLRANELIKRISLRGKDHVLIRLRRGSDN